MIIGVVVTHASPSTQLARCLGALLDDGGLDRLLIVDNGGSAVVPERDDVEIIRTENRGFGAAANDGVDRAGELGADMIALLNDDVVVRPGWLDPLASALVCDHRVGAAQPKLLFADREPPTINSLGVAIDEFGAGHDIGFGEPDREVDAADIVAFTGGAVLFRRSFLDDCGGFDERYFLYYEDVDLAARGRRLGWRYRCEPTSVVEHLGSATTSAQPERTRYLQERNRLWCAFRNGDRRTIIRAKWLSVRRLRHDPKGVHAKAMVAGFAGAPVRLWERSRWSRSR
ncbi:MAG: glycosyltransferase family 2 protein [Ilumatobacter sp.]|nr:glycosyltransferase family 2 protein [Ilumatobacter sp.]